MKINVIMCALALALGALGGYGFFAANGGEPYQLLQALGGGIVLFVTLAGTIALRSATGRGSVANIRVLSAVFFVVFLVEQVIFTFAPFRQAPYIVITGVLLLAYAVIAYAIGKALE